jgi:hypothetical protein
MCILEKAFAKLYGNYSSLIAGSPDQAVTNLIGTPSTGLSLKLKDA